MTVVTDHSRQHNDGDMSDGGDSALSTAPVTTTSGSDTAVTDSGDMAC